MPERILTRHPEGKTGVHIDRAKYDLMKAAILDSLKEVEAVKFKDLRKAVQKRLAGKFEGSISWYYTTVKLDLEARGLIERLPKKSPQLLRLAKRD